MNNVKWLDAKELNKNNAVGIGQFIAFLTKNDNKTKLK